MPLCNSDINYFYLYFNSFKQPLIKQVYKYEKYAYTNDVK